MANIAPEYIRKGGMVPVAAAPLLGVPVVGEVIMIAGVAYMVAEGGKLILDAAKKYCNTSACPDIRTTKETVEGVLLENYVEGVPAVDIASTSEGVAAVDNELIGKQEGITPVNPELIGPPNQGMTPIRQEDVMPFWLEMSEVDKTLSNTKNTKLCGEKYLKKNGIDPHELKRKWLGKKAQIAEYDIYKNTKTGELIIFKKKGLGEGIHTDNFI